MNWRSFYDGPEGPITAQYLTGGRALPTILLIDHNGVIQYEYELGNQAGLDAKIEEMVEAATKANAE